MKVDNIVMGYQRMNSACQRVCDGIKMFGMQCRRCYNAYALEGFFLVIRKPPTIIDGNFNATFCQARGKFFNMAFHASVCRGQSFLTYHGYTHSISLRKTIEYSTISFVCQGT